MKIPIKKRQKIVNESDKLSFNQLAKKYGLSQGEIEKIVNIPVRKPPKWFNAVLVLIPVFVILVSELSLRVIDYGENLDQWVDVGEGKYTINSNIGKKYFTSGAFVPTTNEDYFDIQKKPNAYRVFVLGGSSAEGFPYSPMGSFSRYIRKRLELVYPNTPIEVVNLGMTGVNSYSLLDLLPGVLEEKPDLILIYAGHNEYYGALGVGSVHSFGSSRFLINLTLYLNNFKITQLVRNTMHWVLSLFSSDKSKPTGTLMSRMAKEKNILIDSELYKAGIQQFRENMSDILSLTKERGVPVLMGRIVCNLKDQKPFISVDIPGFKNAEQVFQEAWDSLRSDKKNRADSLFRLAKDLDVLRFRAPSKINKIIEDLGKEFLVPIIPIDSMFNAVSPHGIVGENLIIDHLHPNIKGYQFIGKAFYDAMEKAEYLPKTEDAKIHFDKQDSLTCANLVFSDLDSVIGKYSVKLLKTNWPYTEHRNNLSSFGRQEFINLLQPNCLIDSIAMYRIEALPWVDAHLMAASTYLRKDDIKNYLKHMDVLAYQYTIFQDFNAMLTYFSKNNKIAMSDYTANRLGMIQLLRGFPDDALKYLTEAYKKNPDDQQIIYHIALANFEMNNVKTALIIVNHCLDIQPDYTDAKELRRKILNTK